MNISEFREKYPQYKDIDDQTLADKFHAKYYSDIPVEEFNAKFLGTKPTTQKLERSQGNWMQRTAGAVAPWTKNALPIGGALAGGAIGSAAGPVGSVAGAGLGMAAGDTIQRGIEAAAGQRPGTTVPESLAAAGQAGLQGATMEAGGAVIGKGLEWGLQQVAKAAPRIYESVAKIPPRAVPKFERDKAIGTALEYKIPATQKGYAKLRGMIEATNEKIADVINEAQSWTNEAVKRNVKSGIKEFHEGKLSVPDILKRLESVRDWAYKSFADPTPVLQALKEYKTGVMKLRGKEISVGAAQKLKQGIYRRLTDASYGEYSTPQKEMDKAFARGIKEELFQAFPVLQNLNAKDSALIGLSNILEKTVNRTRNWDLAGLSEYGGAIGGGTIAGGPGAGIGLIVAKMLKSPAVMSRVAFALNRAAKLGGAPTVSRAIGAGISSLATPNVQPAISGAMNTADKMLNKPAAADDFGMPQPGNPQGFDIQWKNRRVPNVPIDGQQSSPADPLVNTATSTAKKGTKQGYDNAIKILRAAIKRDPSRTDELEGLIDRYTKDKRYAQL